MHIIGVMISVLFFLMILIEIGLSPHLSKAGAWTCPGQVKRVIHNPPRGGLGDWYHKSMTTRKVPLAPNEYYHLYSRGVDKRSIFLDSEDEKRFVRLLFLCNGSKPIVYKKIKNLSLNSIEKGESQTAIGAYCLMPNHFHILVKETKEGGITKFMSKLLTAYSSYFNTKYERAGALFSSEFKSAHLGTDEHLKYIFSYIHLNPLKISNPDWRKEKLDKRKVEDVLGRYWGSSYQDYVGKERDASSILNRLAFPEYFLNVEEFKDNLLDWFTQEPSPPLGTVIHR